LEELNARSQTITAKMGEDVRFARNSQKNIRELIGRHETAQSELFHAIQELHKDVQVLRNKPLMKKLSTASFAMRELQNNWNSLQFAFEHLMVDKGENKKNENNNIKKEKIDKELAKNDDESESEDDDEDDDELDSKSVEPAQQRLVSPRRSPRVRRSSSRASESQGQSSSANSGRSTPIREPAPKKATRKSLTESKRPEQRKRNNSELQAPVAKPSGVEQTDQIEIVPKRESLRRVLELSKQEYESQNRKDSSSDEEEQQDQYQVKFEAKTEPLDDEDDDEDERLSAEQQQSQDNPPTKIITQTPTPKKVPTLMPKVESLDNKDLPYQPDKKPAPAAANNQLTQQTGSNTVNNVVTTTTTTTIATPSPLKKRPRAKEPKTDPKILARQRELYHKRKERQKNDPNFSKKDKLVKMVKLDQKVTEKGKPWSKIQERKTPPQILEKRKRQYHEKRLKEKQAILNQQSGAKSFQKIEPASQTTTVTNRIAITPTKASHKSFSFVTVVPPVVTSEQYKTFQSLSELNDHPTLLVTLPTTTSQSHGSSSIITKSVIAAPFKQTLETKSPNAHPRLPKKRNWSIKETSGVIVGSTNGGTSLPGNKETERTTAPGSDNASGSKSSSDYKYMRKKVLAKHWEEANSTSTTSSDKDKDDLTTTTAPSTASPPSSPSATATAPTKTSPPPPPPPSTPPVVSPTPPPQPTPPPSKSTSANHILKNRLTQQSALSVE